MREVVEGVHLLDGFPRYGINVYLVGEVLVDAGARFDARRILRQLKGRKVSAHMITHAHPDHQGSSAGICRELNLPLWCGRADVEAMESGVMPTKDLLTWLIDKLTAGPGYPVSRVLEEGDTVEDFTVLETPGHSPGHLALWRETDRTLILGDVLFNRHPLFGGIGLREPPYSFSTDPILNQESIRRCLALEPRTICFGHGPPLKVEPGDQLLARLGL